MISRGNAGNSGKSGKFREFRKSGSYIYKHPGNSGKSGKFDPVLHLQAHRLAPRVLIAPRGAKIFFFIQGYLEEMPEIPGKCRKFRKFRKIREIPGISENPEESGKSRSSNANSYANNLGKSGIHEFHKIQCYIYKHIG